MCTDVRCNHRCTGPVQLCRVGLDSRVRSRKGEPQRCTHTEAARPPAESVLINLQMLLLELAFVPKSTRFGNVLFAVLVLV